jgi:hypothetical protein
VLGEVAGARWKWLVLGGSGWCSVVVVAVVVVVVGDVVVVVVSVVVVVVAGTAMLELCEVFFFSQTC